MFILLQRIRLNPLKIPQPDLSQCMWIEKTVVQLFFNLIPPLTSAPLITVHYWHHVHMTTQSELGTLLVDLVHWKV